MNTGILDIVLEDFNVKVPAKYVFCEQKNRFIYNRPSKGTIVGMTQGLINRVVEKREERFSGDRRFSLLYIDDVSVGWVETEDMLRVYRLPNIHGKFVTYSESIFNGASYKEALERLKERMVRAKYYFIYNEVPYLLVESVGDEGQVPLPYKDFAKLVGIKDTHHITLPKGTPLYSTSRLDSIIARCKEEKKVKVVSFFKGTAQTKIKMDGQTFWMNGEASPELDGNDQINVDALETIDTLAYLKERSDSVSKKLNQRDRTLNLIRENINIGSDLETLYFKKYIGTVGDSDDD